MLRSRRLSVTGGRAVNQFSNLMDQASKPSRRSGTERRGPERRDMSHASSADRFGGTGVDRRIGERRRGERRAAERTLSGVPPLVCPDCNGSLEYEPELSWRVPGVYTVDTGYCPACSRRFLRNRDTGTYDSLSWTPLCRICRESVGDGRATGQAGSGTYHCLTHPTEEWQYEPQTDRWTARAHVGVPRDRHA